MESFKIPVGMCRIVGAQARSRRPGFCKEVQVFFELPWQKPASSPMNRNKVALCCFNQAPQVSVITQIDFIFLVANPETRVFCKGLNYRPHFVTTWSPVLANDYLARSGLQSIDCNKTFK